MFPILFVPLNPRNKPQVLTHLTDEDKWRISHGWARAFIRDEGGAYNEIMVTRTSSQHPLELVLDRPAEHYIDPDVVVVNEGEYGFVKTANGMTYRQINDF